MESVKKRSTHISDTTPRLAEFRSSRPAFRPAPHRKILDAFRVLQERKDAELELVDIASYNLPLLDEPIPRSRGRYAHEHTKLWPDKIASFDAYVFVTPEYNHSMSGALKNAIDYLYREWNNKVAGFVSYGGHAVAHVRWSTCG